MHIVFKIFPAHSHLNATFKFALSLKARGYQVTYVGVKQFEKEVLMQGFEYFIDSDVLPQPVPNSRKPSFVEQLKSKKLFKELHKEYLEGCAFDRIIDGLNPHMIVVDSPYVRHSIPLLDKGIPFVIFESMVALNKAPLHPPLSSKIIPERTLFNQLLVQIAWRKYFFKSFVDQLLYGEIYPPKYLIKKLARTTNYPVNEIDFNRYFHLGLNNIPEIIASPKEFDFPYKKRSNQYYIGSSVYDNRNEVSYDLKYEERKKNIDRLLVYNKSCKLAEKVALLYCSFGSMSWRYEGVNKFYKKLIDAFGNDANIQIFISIGYDISYHLFKDLPNNIHIFRKVPQLELLKQMDLMITHGGMNTITECILSEVPMLVYPGNNKIDQVGNACRVAFHGIGLMGDLKKDSHSLLKKKVNTLLTNVSYKDNIREMKSKIVQNEDFNEILSLIDKTLNKNEEIHFAKSNLH